MTLRRSVRRRTDQYGADWEPAATLCYPHSDQIQYPRRCMVTESTSSVTGHPAKAGWNEQLKTLVGQYGYGTILISCLLVLWWGVEGPYPLEWVSNGLYVLMIFVILGLELWIPFTRSWGDIRKATRADVIYFLLAGPIDFLNILLLVTLLAGTAQYHHYIQVFDIWPNHFPILIQLLFAILIVDFFKYWYHRWTHEVPLLWRYHTIHHSLDRLEMLRASYFYPIDIFLTVGLGTLAMLMVGVGYELIIFHNVYAGITGLLNHSNADHKCGFFDSFLNSIGHHRAHHAVGLPGRESNYGSFFNFADRIFGTRYLPEDQGSFDPLGLDDSYDMPDTVLRQLAVPFRWRQVHKEN
jgi:sterol desaturase/sphingolipid hydroxylase (fatty acid hydroxylase superfamily)